MPSLIEIGPVVLEKKMKMLSLQTDGRTGERTTDNRRSEKLT